jgi:hypothetical protein
MDKKITKLAIFDFDGTLVDTELPETGKQIWLKKTRKEWPHIGWWGKADSLDTEIFDNKLIVSVKEAYDVVRTQEETLSVMLTGRRLALAKEVNKILKLHDLVFDEHHFNTGGATEVCKMRTIDRLLTKYPDVEEISIWEDRLTHIDIFHDFLHKKLEEGRIKNFSVHYVPSQRHEDKTH